jgi:hypothetical protein
MVWICLPGGHFAKIMHFDIQPIFHRVDLTTPLPDPIMLPLSNVNAAQGWVNTSQMIVLHGIFHTFCLGTTRTNMLLGISRVNVAAAKGYSDLGRAPNTTKIAYTGRVVFSYLLMLPSMVGKTISYLAASVAMTSTQFIQEKHGSFPKLDLPIFKRNITSEHVAKRNSTLLTLLFGICMRYMV